jgi:hypothetical protein
MHDRFDVSVGMNSTLLMGLPRRPHEPITFTFQVKTA